MILPYRSHAPQGAKGQSPDCPAPWPSRAALGGRVHTPSGEIDCLDSAAALAYCKATLNVTAQPLHVFGLDITNFFERDLGEHCRLVVQPPPGDTFQIVAYLVREDGRRVRLPGHFQNAGHIPGWIDFHAKGYSGIFKRSSNFVTSSQSGGIPIGCGLRKNLAISPICFVCLR